MLLSLDETKGDNDIEVVFIVDEDIETLEAIHGYWFAENSIIDFSTTKRGALFCWNRGLQICTGDVITCMGDDQIFYGGWLDHALESHKEKLDGYGVVGMNDLAYNGDTQVATMFLFDRKYCKDHMGGIFAPPVYHYYCVDSEWNEKAKMLGRFYWDSHSIVEHVHSAHGKRPVDALDQEKIDNEWQKVDNETFEKRKREGFPVTWSPLT